jgi:menaquinone-dependent protoporphyrinogen oxidase
MKKKILVTYSSRYGSTAEIAEKIAEVIAAKGNEVQLSEIKEAPDLREFSAVILGSAVYIGRWRKDAVRFMKIHENELAERQTWIFSTGPTGKGDPVELLEGWNLPKNLKPIADRIAPEDVTVFHGSVDPEKLSGMHKYMVGKVNVPVGDFRIWAEIEKWGEKIAEQLSKSA